MKGTLTEEQKAHSHRLQRKILELEKQIKELEKSLPSQAG